MPEPLTLSVSLHHLQAEKPVPMRVQIKLSRLIMFMRMGYTGGRAKVRDFAWGCTAALLAGCSWEARAYESPPSWLLPADPRSPPITTPPYSVGEVACHLGECPKHCCTPWHIQPKSPGDNTRRYHRRRITFWVEKEQQEWDYRDDPPLPE